MVPRKRINNNKVRVDATVVVDHKNKPLEDSPMRLLSALDPSLVWLPWKKAEPSARAEQV